MSRIKSKTFEMIVYLIIAITCVSCAIAPPRTRYLSEVSFALSDKNEEQTQEGITIKLRPLDVGKEYKEPKYINKFHVVYTPLLSSTPVMKEIDKTVSFYDDLLPFEVTIVNNTDHILRMSQSRVAYIDPSSDEPVMALDQASIMQDIQSLPVYQNLYEYFKDEYNLQNDMSVEITQAITLLAGKMKFVNAFNREIMPSMKYTGVIVFPVDLEKASEGKISFIDMISKTDNAGNPTAKVRFDYRVKPISKYYRYNPTTDKDWVEIDETEYQTGMSQEAQK